MGIINKLQPHLAELIAAGEVVERPASIVKELVENSLDAGASAITVEIKNGGMTFLRVTDNGSGIYRDDVESAFLSHATSKIKNESDLECITTMGFRGEALSSVASVSRVELLTRRDDEAEGTRYITEGSVGQEVLPAGCPKGTTIIVRDLFYNTPARLKFIKKDISEANAVASVMDKLAVSHPDISFKLLRDGELKLNTPGDSRLLSAVYAVYGKEFTAGLTEVNYKSAGLSIDGLTSKPESSRANRTMQSFFINGRFVKSRTCAAALEEAYKGAIMIGRFPACVLNLTIPPNTVDVNVHPAKIEVRFENEKAIFDLVYFGVKNAITAQQAPQINYKSAPQSYAAQPQFTQQHISAAEFRSTFSNEAQKTQFAKNSAFFEQSSANINNVAPLRLKDDNDLFTKYKTLAPLKEENKTLKAALSYTNHNADEEQEQKTCKASELANAKFIGEAFSTYILLQNDNKLIIVDKHAAHERIIFNRIKNEQVSQFSQALLMPKNIVLSREEHEIALENLSVLARCGFEAEDFDGTLLVRTAPMWLKDEDITSAISEICENIKAYKHDITPQRLENLYHSVACRSAIKGGNKSFEPELSEIIRLLEDDPSVQHCPHGRPVCVTMSRYELEKQFGRV
ncbi:MAG: DNA mismatch repair endonuclease MutL [Hydrogenoanaerobacterium sp.]